jgi:rod shape-determining protein MreD
VLARVNFVTGLIAGTIGGLAQDALAGGIVGIGGMTKTLIGFVVGVLGAQFNLSTTVPRLVMFVAATFVHEVMFEGLHAMVGGRPFGLRLSATLVQALVNGLVGVSAVLLVEHGPEALQRGACAGNIRQNYVHEQSIGRSPQFDDPVVGGAIPRRRALCRPGGLSGCSRLSSTEVRRDGGEQPDAPAAAARAARGAARPEQESRREPGTWNLALVREQLGTSRGAQGARLRHRHRRGRCATSYGAGTSRLIARSCSSRTRAGAGAAAGARRLSCPGC